MCIRDSVALVLTGMVHYSKLNTEAFLATAFRERGLNWVGGCLLYTSDAADERSSVDLGGRRIINKKKTDVHVVGLWFDESGFGMS